MEFSFKEMENLLRIDRAEPLVLNRPLPISEILYKIVFSSI